MKKYNIIFASHPDYSGNAKAIYEYMKKCSAFKQYNLFWVSYENETYEKMKSKNIKCVKYDTKEFYSVFDKTDIVIFTHDELISLKKSNQIYIYLDHGKGCKKVGYFLEEKNMVDNDFEYLNYMYDSIDYIICSSQLTKLFYHVAFDISMKRILDIGTPRTDYLYRKDAKIKLQKVCKKDINMFSRKILYLPTIRSGIGRKKDGNFNNNNILNLENYDEDKLNDYLKKNNYLLIVKFHPYEQNIKKKENYSNIVYIDEQESRNNLIYLPEYISSVDMVIGDYSSAHVEYLILDKPVCFLNRDIKSYMNNRGILLDDFKFWFPGPLIKDFSTLIREIDKLFSDKNYYSLERKYFVNLMFGKNIKDNCKRFCNYFFEENKNILQECNEMKKKEYRHKYKMQKEVIDNKNHEIAQMKNKNLELINLKKELQARLDNIENSKGWKILEKIREVKNNFRQ